MVDNLLPVNKEQASCSVVAKRRMHDRSSNAGLATTRWRDHQDVRVPIGRMLAADVYSSLLVIAKLNHSDSYTRANSSSHSLPQIDSVAPPSAFTLR